MVEKIAKGQELTFNLLFEQDKESGWFVARVAELPGCISQGETLDEAKANIADAIESYVEVLFELAVESQTVKSKTTVDSSAQQVHLRPHFSVCV